MPVRWRAIALVVCALAWGAPVNAQASRAADSLLRIGAIDRAETAYYAASRAHPRDPQARFALGKFLASRGAFRIGATLIDESEQFGYDRQAGNEALAPILRTIGEYGALEKLSPSPLTSGERAQVKWLVSHPSRVTSPDSSVLVALARTSGDGFVGTTRIRINGASIVALIAPRSGCGMRIADTTVLAQSLRRFPSEGEGRGIAAAADSIAFGRMSISNVPVTIEQLREGAQAIVCFGFLARYAPTFDAKAGLMTLHLAGIAPRSSATATAFPVLDLNGSWAIPQSGGWRPLMSPKTMDILRDRRWTFDPRRGQIEVEP